jgi:hypothetical protein
MFKFAHLILGAGLTIGATAAVAGDLPQEAADAMMNSCRADYHRLCSYVVPGDGRAARCLLSHETELAPVCLKAVKVAYSIEACLPDYERFCPGVPKGPQVLDCLASRIDMLRPDCHRVVAENQPYAQPRGERYSYNGGGYGPAPAPAPYSQPGFQPYGYGNQYAYGERYQGGAPYQGGPYAGEGEPRYQPYGAYPYSQGQQDDGRYAEQSQPRYQPYGERYAGEGDPRYQPYSGRYAGGGYTAPGYGNGAPREPYEPEEEGER